MGSPGAGYGRLGLGAAAGGSLLGYGLSMDPQLQHTDMPSWAGDQNAINQQMQQQQGMNQDYMNQMRGFLGGQNDQLNQQFQAQNQNLTNQLTSTDPSSLGQQLQARFNNMGQAGGGAFDASLANQFSTLAGNQGIQAMQQNQTNTNDLAGILNQGYQTQSGLGMGGLQRQFGLEDTGTQNQMTENLARFIQQSGLQQGLIGGGSNILGQTSGGGGGGGGK